MHATASNFSRASLWEWAQTTLLGANIAWTTLCLGGYRPETMAITSALTGATLAIHFVARAVEKPGAERVPIHPASWWLLPFLFYAAVNVLVISPVRWLGWLDWLGWANLSAVFWVTLNGVRSTRPRQALFLTLAALGIVAVLMACYQRFLRPDWLMLGRHQMEQFLGRASGPFGIPNSFAAFLLLLLPAAGALAIRRRANATERVWWGWVTLVFALGLLLTLSRGAFIGLALAMVVGPLVVSRWRWRRRVMWGAVILGGWAGAGGAIYGASPKVRERFDRLVRDSGELSRPILWHGAWELFRERPIVGTGAGSYHVLFERHRPERFADAPQWAHNDYLNTLSDYGAMGFVLFFGAAGVIAIRFRPRETARDRASHDWLDSPVTTSALGVGLLAFALQLFVDFHFKIPALAMTFAVVAAMALGRPPAWERASDARRRRVQVARFSSLAVAAGIGIVIIPITRFYRAEGIRYRVRQTIDARASSLPEGATAWLGQAESELRRALALCATNAQAWADLAFTLELQGVVEPARVGALAGPAVQAAQRAVALSGVVPEFWIRLGVALDMQGRAREAQAAFERSVQLAPRHAHGWYYYAAHLSLDTEQRGAALRAIANSLSLDPGNRAAEALRAKLNER